MMSSLVSSEGKMSVWALLAIIIRGRVVVLSLTLGVPVLVLAVALLSPRSYEVETSFRPQSASGQLGQLSMVASQFGISLPNQSDGDSPDFYAALIRSRPILGRIADRKFSGVLEHDATLEQILAIDDPSIARRRESVIRWLDESVIHTSIMRETGIVLVVVETRYGILSSQLAVALLEEINWFNARTRSSQASAERAFVEDRASEAKRELAQAEDALREFLQVNRTFESSPTLRFEHDRLLREVNRRQQLFGALEEAFERARIAEVRDTPVITVLQSPYVPINPKSRKLLLKLVAGAVFGFLVGCVAAMSRQARQSLEAHERESYEEVMAWWSLIKKGKLREAL